MTEPEFRATLASYLASDLPRRQAISIAHDRVAGEELVQAAAVRALEQWAKYDPAKPLGAWFWFVMLNLQRATWAKAAKTLSLDAPVGDDGDEDGLTHADLLVSSDAQLEAGLLSAAEEARLSERARVALAGLRADERMAVIAHDLQGLDWPACALGLGCEERRVKTLVASGRAAFKTLYAVARDA